MLKDYYPPRSLVLFFFSTVSTIPENSFYQLPLSLKGRNSTWVVNRSENGCSWGGGWFSRILVLFRLLE